MAKATKKRTGADPSREYPATVGDLAPDERNPRKITEQAADGLRSSLSEFGDIGGITFNLRTKTLIAGHQRVAQLGRQYGTNLRVVPPSGKTDRGFIECPNGDLFAVRFVDWDEDRARLANVTANNPYIAGEFDASVTTFLGEYVDEIGDLFGDLRLAELYSDYDKETISVVEDDVPALPDKAVTNRGDLWILGKHRLLCGDSALVEDVDRLIGGAQVHLVNTDPPYNVRVEPRSNNAIAAGLSSFQGVKHHRKFDVERRPKTAKATGKKLRAKDRPLENDFVSDEMFDALLRAWFGNMSRVLLPGHAAYIWGGYANCANYPPVLKAVGLYFSQAIIWVKEHPVLTRKDFMGNHEWCFYCWKEGAAHRFFGNPNRVDVWEVKRSKVGTYTIGRGMKIETADGSSLQIGPARDESLQTVIVGDGGIKVIGSDAVIDVWHVKKVPPTKMIHLTEKPVELAARAMKYSSLESENVLDLFGGSGSTLMAAEQMKRRAMLMEMDPLYCDVIVERWQKFTGDSARRA